MHNIPIDLRPYRSLLKGKIVQDKEDPQKQKKYVFGHIREKWLVYQPEELVRQLLIHYLIETLDYNKNRIQVERQFMVNKRRKRLDILVFDEDAQPFLLIECKAPDVPINELAMRQIGIYNLELKIPYLLVTNGQTSYCCKIDFENEDKEYLQAIPKPPSSH